MREQELWKKVPIYFYYLSISKHKDAKDDCGCMKKSILVFWAIVCLLPIQRRFKNFK